MSCVCNIKCANFAFNDNSQKTKKVFCFLGMPGSGKSTQINFLNSEIENCKVFHVGKFSKALSIPKKSDGSLIEGLDKAFLDYVKSEMTDFTILDGFPRSIAQLQMLENFANINDWQITYIHIAFPVGMEESLSLQRQISREGDSDIIRIKGKIKRALECDMQVIKSIYENSNYFHIDAINKSEIVRKEVAKAVLSSYFQNPFANSIIKEVANSTDETAYISRSFIYTQTWNNRFGSMQEPNDIDVLGNCELSLLKSRRYALKKEISNSENIIDILAKEAFSFYRISIAVNKNGFTPIFVNVYDVYDTLNGIVSVNNDVVHEGKLIKILKRYPMLRVSEYLNSILENVGVFHKPLQILQDFENINMVVAKEEYGGKPDMLYAETQELKRQMLFAKIAFEKAKKTPSAPLRWSNAQISISQDYAWEVCAKELDDNSFREYLHKQVNSRKGEKDAFIQSIVNYDFVKNGNVKTDQKATHQGWLLHFHLIESCLQLKTDHLPKEMRLVLRTAMLLHDAGKVKNSNTPGSHQGIGAKIFLQNAPSFLTSQEIELVSFFIKHHDIFGRMYRGITEVNYTGAIHPKKVVQIIKSMPICFDYDAKTAILLEVWKADVGSVSTLRWILTLLPYIKRVLIEASF